MIDSKENIKIEDGVSVIVPVFNEEAGIAPFLSQLSDVLADAPFASEIIVIDDGSDDDTPNQLKNSSYKVIRHDFNLGYGAAIKTGIEHSRYQTIVIIDGDGSYLPKDILTVVKPLARFDMVVGARTTPDAQIPLLRRPAKWMVRVFAERLARHTIPDLNSGLRAFRRDKVNPILRLLPDGFSLTTTITVAFLTSGKRVDYQPIHYNKRTGHSKFRPITDTWNMILLILRTVVLLRPLNVFLPLSFSLALLALGVLVVSKIQGRFMDATFIVLMMASVQMFVLGLIADLVVRINLWTH